MPKSSSIIAAVLAGLALSGCASPGTTAKPATTGATPPATNRAAVTAARPADPRQIQDVMAELRQSGTIDPAAEEQLAEDLRQSDPSIWPLVIEQCRATQAYRRQANKLSGAPGLVRRLPPVDAELPPVESAQNAYPSASAPVANGVTQASYSAPPDEWRQQWNGATETLPKREEAAPLFVRNAAFCSEALSFGCIKQFDKCEFFQDQNLLLYAELENFTSEQTDKGFRTSLRSGYQIVDHLGRQVVWREFAATQDYCKSARHDFFIVFRLRLPKQIVPGKYLLRLVIQDTTSLKIGQASIDFVVKEGKAEERGRKAEGGKEKAEGGRGKGEKETKT